ncbi:uncharacterized protein Pyn_41145 [Prunus yedoensis var. nudiflora]|uniref:Uncharacterized protein n=1 Tax=Prunus yedoensis var. nudiflora TaxID=2094558 RepID=A0A314V051_PRUYE|nr:uncharacterized protein Pyn_41145 [Prunus yedoensis var. nudiflora]
MPWRRRNAYDEDGRVWYEECISARFIRPDGEAVRAALKNADWDPLTPKGTKVKEGINRTPSAKYRSRGRFWSNGPSVGRSSGRGFDYGSRLDCGSGSQCGACGGAAEDAGP